jgi:hypothetical protein
MLSTLVVQSSSTYKIVHGAAGPDPGTLAAHAIAPGYLRLRVLGTGLQRDFLSRLPLPLRLPHPITNPILQHAQSK